ncbi:MotA/TolQ/ExbB proton channel family protein [Sphingomonas sp. ID0503]|uniref:MotA/TolQ/ExbB proton channel family protein n=1 Tax=Sphingomonas sp. ID0503 TaxID=3399691 RepID=UPI003AFB3CDB
MATPAAPAPNQFGLVEALEQGGAIAIGTFAILVIMSAASWYVIFTKLWEQQKILNQAKTVRRSFWGTPTLRDGAAKLEKNSAFRQIVDDGLKAQDEHTKLIDPVDQHEWLESSIGRSQQAINSKLGNGLAILATVGSTSPFVGLFGTVVGIYRALIKIGAAGQASIDTVAGPVGEALIMTAIGLVVAVPAVLGYNWLIRRNKVIAEQLGSFSTDLHGYLVSNGALKPTVAAARPVATPAAPIKK